jgi:hypothetical protein
MAMVTPPTAADTSAPTLGPLSCRITPFRILQLDGAGSGRERAACTARRIAAVEIARAVQIQCTAYEFGDR